MSVSSASASINTKKLEGKLDALVNLVTQLAVQQKFSPIARVFGKCSSDPCPSLQPPQHQMPPPIQQFRQHSAELHAPVATLPPSQSSPSLVELLRQINLQNMQFQQETRASIQSLTNQMGQMATQLNQAQSQNLDKLPSQTVQNPKNVSAITLRSGKQIDIPAPPTAVVPPPEPTLEKEGHTGSSKNLHAGRPSSITHGDDLYQPPIPLPFPPKSIPSKKMEEVDKEILETFRKVEVNIPLLDAIKQIPRYAKFLKDLCTHKRKLKGTERVNMGKNVSALIGKSVPQIPEKCTDSGSYFVPPPPLRKDHYPPPFDDWLLEISHPPLHSHSHLSLDAIPNAISAVSWHPP